MKEGSDTMSDSASTFSDSEAYSEDFASADSIGSGTPLFGGQLGQLDTRSFFEINVSKRLGPDMAYGLADAMRLLSIQIVVQALLYFNNPACDAFFTSDFVLMSLYIVTGALVYWLIVRRIVKLS